jgi:hypothetical protein
VRHPLILSIALVAAVALGCRRPTRLAADLVITNGQVWTGNVLQPDARDDVFAIPAARLKDVQVLTTVAGGKVVHQRRP